MEVTGPASLGAEQLGEPMLRLGTWCGVGFVVGAISAFGAYELYPPASSQVGTVLALAVVTLMVMAALYGIARRLADARSGDWLVLGFTLALVLAASLVVARELLTLIYDELPAAVWLEGLDPIRARAV